MEKKSKNKQVQNVPMQDLTTSSAIHSSEDAEAKPVLVFKFNGNHYYCHNYYI